MTDEEKREKLGVAVISLAQMRVTGGKLVEAVRLAADTGGSVSGESLETLATALESHTALIAEIEAVIETAVTS